jgi:nitroreductase
VRRIAWLLLPLAACAGPDSDPVKVAEEFHALRLAGDDRGIHALLTEADRAAMPLESVPADLPAGLAAELIGGETSLESTRLLSAERDTAAVVLRFSGGDPDTLHLVATHDPIAVFSLELDRVRWRVSMGLAEWALIDSLATALHANTDPTRVDAVERATAYLAAAERHPRMARPADLASARSTIREAAVAEALNIDLEVTESFMGTRFVSGRIENPTPQRVATLRLMVTDKAGQEERVELWDIAPSGTTPVSRLTQLDKGRLTHRLERIQVY